jgi:hypothetical protein
VIRYREDRRIRPFQELPRGAEQGLLRDRAGLANDAHEGPQMGREPPSEPGTNQPHEGECKRQHDAFPQPLLHQGLPKLCRDCPRAPQWPYDRDDHRHLDRELSILAKFL